MAAVCGIHFGNTNSVITVFKDDKIETVATEIGDRYTPSALAYTGSEKVVGVPAKQYMLRNPESCITNIKLLLGRSFSDPVVEKCISSGNCKVIDESSAPVFEVLVNENRRNVTPEAAATLIFTKLLESGEAIGGEDLEDVVVTYPVYFNEKQRILLSEAAEEAGLNVLRLISEPSAAVLAYDIGQKSALEDMKVLVFRVGGDSMDATVIQVQSGMYQTIECEYDLLCGAVGCDKVLAESLFKDFQRKYKMDPRSSKRAVKKMMTASESCKRLLSTKSEATISIDSLYEGLDYQSTMTRAKFESICSDIFAKCTSLVDSVLKKSNLSPDDIDKVVLVGGGTKIPRLQSIIKSKLSKSEFLQGIDNDQVIAHGACLQAALLSGKDGTNCELSSYELDCISKNLCVRVQNSQSDFVSVVKQHTPIPILKKVDITATPSEKSVVLEIFETGDSGSDKDATLLGQIVLDKLETPEVNLSCSMDLKRDGSIVVSLAHKQSQQTQLLTIGCG